MSDVLLVYSTVLSRDDVTYPAEACGAELPGGTWEAWIEFLPDDGSAPLRTERESTQPSRRAAQYWAEGLEPVYLEGALERAVTAHVPAEGAAQ